MVGSDIHVDEARKIVADTFFQDEIELYRNEIQVDSIGEEHEVEVLVGTFKCNLQYAPASVTTNVSGKDISQTMRISLAKDFSLDNSFTYKVRIKKARIQFDDRFWKVQSWQESQISTVLYVTREVLV